MKIHTFFPINWAIRVTCGTKSGLVFALFVDVTSPPTNAQRYLEKYFLK